MSNRAAMVLSLALIGGVAGCRSVAPPNWDRPGAVKDQRYNAHRFDPYPENETGPAVIGGRPREFTNPPAEVKRARWALPPAPIAPPFTVPYLAPTPAITPAPFPAPFPG